MSGAWQCAVGALGSISASRWWLIAGVTTVILGLIIWVDATRRKMTPAAKLESVRRDALARVQEAKVGFDTAVQRSNAAVSSYPSDMVARALDAYDTISGT